jgi:periplasmic divalent cation tolerance protein
VAEDTTHEEIVEVIVTGPPRELPLLVRLLVNEGLIACGQITQDIRSLFRWEGAVEDDVEARVAMHTRASLIDDVIARVNVEHSYETPCIIATPIIAADPGYQEWVIRETREP